MRARLAAAAALLAVLAASPPSSAAPDARAVAAEVMAPGVVQERWVVPGASAAVHVARRDPGSPAGLRLVQAHDAVDRGLEPTSAMCRRTAGCRVAVNGDFFTPTGAPVGAVVVDGRMLRSPRPGHEQLSLEPLRVTTSGLGDGGWSGEVQLPDDRPPLRLSGVNVGLTAGALVLYTSAFGASTPACTCLELRLREESLPAATLGRAVPVGITGSSAGQSPLPPGTAVIAGEGPAAQALAALLAAPVPLALWVTTTAPTTHNVGVHPVLLRDGRPEAYDAADPMLADPHPRTLVGWDRRGTVWLVASEGRRPGAPGLTAAQAISFLQGLGATDAVMLDGGGSTTFVSRGEVVSSPSDGAERPVANALVLTWAEPTQVMAVRTAASPQPVMAAAPEPVPVAVSALTAAAPVTPVPSAEPAVAPVPRAPDAAPMAARGSVPPPEPAAPALRRLPPAGETSFSAAVPAGGAGQGLVDRVPAAALAGALLLLVLAAWVRTVLHHGG